MFKTRSFYNKIISYNIKIKKSNKKNNSTSGNNSNGNSERFKKNCLKKEI